MDYTNEGFDNFLSRSIDDLSQANLSATGPQTNSMRYDSSQISGMLGDTLQIGKIRLENTRIIVNDGNNDFLLIGEDV
jgi:hypothetical protein